MCNQDLVATPGRNLALSPPAAEPQGMCPPCNESCGSSPELDAAKLAKLELEASELAKRIERHEQEIEYGKMRLEESELRLEETRFSSIEKAAKADRHRRYGFFGAVTASSVSDCIGTLQHWHRQDPTCPIEIVLNSPGGDVLHGLALYDDLIALRDAGHHITITVRGMAASMGGILLQAASADSRVVGKNSHVLIHEISTGAVGKLSEIEDEAKFCEMLSAQLLAILAERSTMTAAQIKRKWRKTDWWLNADQAVELGFADRIG